MFPLDGVNGIRRNLRCAHWVGRGSPRVRRERTRRSAALPFNPYLAFGNSKRFPLNMGRRTALRQKRPVGIHVSLHPQLQIRSLGALGSKWRISIRLDRHASASSCDSRCSSRSGWMISRPSQSDKVEIRSKDGIFQVARRRPGLDLTRLPLRNRGEDLGFPPASVYWSSSSPTLCTDISTGY